MTSFLELSKHHHSAAATASASTISSSQHGRHTIIPADIGLPGTAPSLLLIFCEENCPGAAERIRARDAMGLTVLHLGCVKACPIVFLEELLGDSYRARVDAVDYQGNTSLHYACEAKNEEHVRLLLAHGADRFLLNGQGVAPDISFLTEGDDAAAPLLLSHGLSSSSSSRSFYASFDDNNSTGGASASSASLTGKAKSYRHNSRRSRKQQNLQHTPHYLTERLQQPLPLFYAEDVEGEAAYDDDDAVGTKKSLLLQLEASKACNMELAVPLRSVPWKSPPPLKLNSKETTKKNTSITTGGGDEQREVTGSKKNDEHDPETAENPTVETGENPETAENAEKNNKKTKKCVQVPSHYKSRMENHMVLPSTTNNKRNHDDHRQHKSIFDDSSSDEDDASDWTRVRVDEQQDRFSADSDRNPSVQGADRLAEHGADQDPSSSTAAAAVWFTVISRVRGAEERDQSNTFLVGGMIRINNEFQFNGLPFALSEVQMLEQMQCARYVSLQSSGSPIVVELLTSTIDTNLPTLVRCFRDDRGIVAAVELRRKQRQEAARQAQLATKLMTPTVAVLLEQDGKNKPKVDAGGDDQIATATSPKRTNKNIISKSAQQLTTAEQQTQTRAITVLRIFTRRMLYTERFRSMMITVAERLLLSKRFLRTSLLRIKFCRGVMYHVMSSFLRYASAELMRFPERCELYCAMSLVVRSFVANVEEERFISRSWLYSAVDAAFRARMSRLVHSPPPATEHYRNKLVWCLTIEEVVEQLVKPLSRAELSPIIAMAEKRDAFLPRSLLYSLRQRPDAREIFEDMARSKLMRTLVDLASSYRGRQQYLELRVLQHNGKVGGAAAAPPSGVGAAVPAVHVAAHHQYHHHQATTGTRNGSASKAKESVAVDVVRDASPFRHATPPPPARQ